MTLAGTPAGGTFSDPVSDSIAMSVNGTMTVAPGDNYFDDLWPQWTEAEFNVFGNGNGSQARFNADSTIVVRTSVTGSVPTAILDGTTAETNNLTLAIPPCQVNSIGGAPPAIFFTESNAAGAASACACPGGERWDPDTGRCVLQLLPPKCVSSTDCAGWLSVDCVGDNATVAFEGGDRASYALETPPYTCDAVNGLCTASCSGEGCTVTAKWLGSAYLPNVVQACTNPNAPNVVGNCYDIVTPVPQSKCTGPVTASHQCDPSDQLFCGRLNRCVSKPEFLHSCLFQKLTPP
jgi:hypothetical protein